MEDFETLLYAVDGPVATITLNRPETLNTIVPPMPDELAAAVESAVAREPQDELRAVCRAYVEFARKRPSRYRVMFSRHRSGEGGAVNEPRSGTDQLAGADAFSRLVQAVARAEGRNSPEDVVQDAIAVWVTLHGYVSLRDSVPAFPWPPEETLLQDLIHRLAQT